MSQVGNENWSECPKCGARVLINPNTNQPEPCGNCKSQASRTGLYGGVFLLAVAVIGVIALVYFCIRLFVGE